MHFTYLEAVISKVLSVHLLDSLTHTGNITVLQEGILRDSIHFLNVNVLQESISIT